MRVSEHTRLKQHQKRLTSSPPPPLPPLLATISPTRHQPLSDPSLPLSDPSQEALKWLVDGVPLPSHSPDRAGYPPVTLRRAQEVR